MMEEQKNHYDQIDMLRSMAVFMVVWGHLTENTSILYRYLNNLHLPLFFGISGYLLAGSISRHTMKQVFINKVNRLLIPFLSWSMVALTLKTILAIWHQSFTAGIFFNIFTSVFIYADSMWFLWVLFLGSCVIILYKKMHGKKILFWTATVIAYILLPNKILGLGRLKIMLPVFCLGVYIYQHEWGEKPSNTFLKIYGIITGIIFVCLLLFVYDKEMFINFTEFLIPVFSVEIFWYMYYWFIQLTGIFFSIFIIYPVLNKLHLGAPLKIIGKYSLDIYAQHLFFTNYLNIISMRNITNTFLKEIYIFLYAAFIILLCFLISRNILHKIQIYKLLMTGQRIPKENL